MPYQPVSLSSSGVSRVTAVNWIVGKPTLASVTVSTNSSGIFQIQYSLDDQMRTKSSLVQWLPIGTQTFGTVGSTTPANFLSSSQTNVGVTVSFQTPIAGLRLFSSVLAAGQILTMRINSGEGW